MKALPKKIARASQAQSEPAGFCTAFATFRGVTGCSAAVARLLLIGIFLCFPTLRLFSQAATQHEYELKAAVLYHIIEYVDWPADSFSNNAPVLEIGLLGQIPFAKALEVLDGKTVQKRKIVIKQITDPREALHCNVLFIGASEKPRLSRIVGDLNNRPILTVSEVEGFADKEGMVNLVAGPNRIVMEINRETASRSGISFSSKVLKLAKVLPR